LTCVGTPLSKGFRGRIGGGRRKEEGSPQKRKHALPLVTGKGKLIYSNKREETSPMKVPHRCAGRGTEAAPSTKSRRSLKKKGFPARSHPKKTVLGRKITEKKGRYRDDQSCCPKAGNGACTHPKGLRSTRRGDNRRGGHGFV